MRAHDKEPTLNLASLWSLDPSVTYLNHGSFGACPTAVLAAQGALRLELEREPVDFLVAKLPGRLNGARQMLAEFLGAAPEDLVFVANATAAVNAVLRSLALEPGDELLLTNHTYAACPTRGLRGRATGARVVVANLPFPAAATRSSSRVLSCASPRTRLALVDHVTSPTALVLPIVRLVGELRARHRCLGDGAHAPHGAA
jgi:isopenicillin-N epimerase